jgi:NAD(P)-dependent dehydrogenase (short-subunit alcohol dehydrogenase family)
MTAIAGAAALVTGGAKGIGAGVVRALAAGGAGVTIADVDEDAGAQLAAEVGGRFVALDVTDPAAWKALVEASEPFTIVHLNAGVTTTPTFRMETAPLPLTDVTDDAYRRIMAINVDGVVFGARAVLPKMAAAGGGTIVITASMAGLVAVPMDPIYGLTKHAVVGLARALAAGLASSNVDVHAVCPGFVETALLDAPTTAAIKAAMGILDVADVVDVTVEAIASAGRTGTLWTVMAGPDGTVRGAYEFAPPF